MTPGLGLFARRVTFRDVRAKADPQERGPNRAICYSVDTQGRGQYGEFCAAKSQRGLITSLARQGPCGRCSIEGRVGTVKGGFGKRLAP